MISSKSREFISKTNVRIFILLLWLGKRIQSNYVVFGQGIRFSFACKLCCFGRQVETLHRSSQEK